MVHWRTRGRLHRGHERSCRPARSIWPSPIRRSTSATTTTSTTTARTSDDYLDWSPRVDRRRHPRAQARRHVLAGDRRRIRGRAEGHAARASSACTCRSWVIWYYTFGVNCKTQVQPLARAPVPLRQGRRRSSRSTPTGDPRAVGPAAGLRRRAGPNPDTGRLPGRHLDPAAAGLRPTASPPTRTPGTSRASPARSRSGPAFTAARCPSNCWAASSASARNEGDVVLDPFAGSGTTLAVAKKLGRQFLGFELSKDYAKKVNQRLSTIQPGDPLIGPANAATSAPTTRKGRKLRRRELPPKRKAG